ncbi:MAG TPA: hypothetical protein RMG95_14770 [Polyangiaceae bacterium LLY-WYZ-15_(1-7)]|nr:hypothetical protein [Polyangiaceae bacterium LLY-WYZ-15_(1-7)]HJL36951.1 hypothetical protein [Polyangiaceae bacterium LLY-WYZ-15_(1-7)]
MASDGESGPEPAASEPRPPSAREPGPSLRRAWALAGALLLALALFTFLRPAPREVARLEATPADGFEARALSRAIRYSAPFEVEGARLVDVALAAEQGPDAPPTYAHVALVAEASQAVREREAELHPHGHVRFDGVAPGRYSVRLSVADAPVRARVSVGGRNVRLFGAATALLLLPPLWMTLRRRSGRTAA